VAGSLFAQGKPMSSALMAAVFTNHEAADRVRVRLSTGDTAFPTDRVQLTSAIEPGNAGLVPAASFALKLQAYFKTLFDREEEANQVRSLSAAVENGNGVVVVFPRGDIETRHAYAVLQQAKPLQLIEHDLDKQVLEHAASEDTAPVAAEVVEAVTGSKTGAPAGTR
jgi:2',3'-cyclic-nucleotide 2'-phosphodiesterase (5'-nucleotidase family)